MYLPAEQLTETPADRCLVYVLEGQHDCGEPHDCGVADVAWLGRMTRIPYAEVGDHLENLRDLGIIEIIPEHLAHENLKMWADRMEPGPYGVVFFRVTGRTE